MTWQGWVAVALNIIIVLAVSFALAPGGLYVEETESPLLFLVSIFVASSLLFGICLLKGPKPKWRWGASEDDNPDEDY